MIKESKAVQFKQNVLRIYVTSQVLRTFRLSPTLKTIVYSYTETTKMSTLL